VFGNTALRKMSGTKAEEVTQRWKKLQNEKLHELRMLPHNIRLVNSIWTRCVALVAHMGENKMHTGFWWENQKERNCLEYLDVGETVILK
jgi:hypothetical protein